MATFKRDACKFARVTYPYGIEAFKDAKPLSRAERMQARADKLIQEAEDRNARADRIVMWSGITLLCILYFLLDIGLYAWLLS